MDWDLKRRRARRPEIRPQGSARDRRGAAPRKRAHVVKGPHRTARHVGRGRCNRRNREDPPLQCQQATHRRRRRILRRRALPPRSRTRDPLCGVLCSAHRETVRTARIDLHHHGGRRDRPDQVHFFAGNPVAGSQPGYGHCRGITRLHAPGRLTRPGRFLISFTPLYCVYEY